MRIRVAAVAALILVAPFASAPTAGAVSVAPPFLTFKVSPVAGPAGTQITVTGLCNAASTVNLQLRYPIRSDAIPPPIDSTSASVDSGGDFSATLHNNIVNSLQFPPDDPIDLEVQASCGELYRTQPFASTQRTTSNASTIFTGLGQGACGYGFVAPPTDPALPCPPHVKGTDAAGAVKTTNFYAFDGRGRGASVAAGLLDDDATPDLVVGSATGQTTVGVYWAGGGSSTFTPFGGFNGTANVAVGDVIGDSHKEVISGAGPGGGPLVVVSDELGNVLSHFYAYGEFFSGGVTVAAADIDGDGKDEIVTGAGAGGGPHVRAFEGNGQPIGVGFYAYGANFSGGVNVAAGNLAGDGRAEIVTGTQGGGGPHVAIFNADGSKIGPGFYAYDPAFSGGVAVAVGNADGDQGNEIVTGPYLGGDPHVRIFQTTSGATTDPGFYAYSKLPAGVRVAVAR
jgi:hypothetical protein